jgi:phosphopantetheinyl transferase
LLADISNSRRDQILKYHFRINRLQRLASTIMLQNAIGKSKLEFKYGKYNKPYLENSPYNFSFSYSKNIAICALSEEEIGADIEFIHSNYLEYLQAAKLIWSKSLIEQIKSSDDFFKQWTIFEAYSKLKGLGLTNKNDYSGPEESILVNTKKIDHYFLSLAVKKLKQEKMNCEEINYEKIDIKFKKIKYL